MRSHSKKYSLSICLLVIKSKYKERKNEKKSKGLRVFLVQHVLDKKFENAKAHNMIIGCITVLKCIVSYSC